MRIAKIALSSGAVILAVAATFAALHKPTFTTLTTIYYTTGGVSCPFIMVNTLEFTTNGPVGTGVQASIAGKKLWGICAWGTGAHPAHFHR